MKKIAVIIFGLLLAQGVSAQDITFTVPEIPGEIEKSEYAKYTIPAMDCIEWLENHSPNDPHRKKVSEFAVWWLLGTPDVRIELNAAAANFENKNLLILLLGGWAQYAIQYKSDDQLDGCLAGVITALNYYEKYKKELGKDKGAEKLLKMREKGTLKSYLEELMP